MEIRDSIEREMTLKAPIEQVWDAITNPEKLSRWFGDHAEIDNLAEGEPIVFGWGDDLSRGIIHTADRPNVFAFRWQSSRLGKSASFQEAYSTLVTFTLTSIPTGTHLHLIETGFASLPDQIMEETVATSPNKSVQYNKLETEQPLSILENPVQQTVDQVEIIVGSAELKLPHNEQAYKDNVSGWDAELGDLKSFIEQGA